jgi:hypothetical protein
MDRRTFHIL